MVAAIRYSQRDFTSAGLLYDEARELAFDNGDDELVSLTSQNLGIISNLLGDLREAKALYLESIAAAVRCANARNAMIVYNNLAIMCADLRDWMEAEVYFDRATEIAEQLEDIPIQAKMKANRAEPFIRTGQLAQARKTLDAAEKLARQVNDKATQADIARFRSMIAREEGDLEAAAEQIAYSLQLAVEAGLDLEHAEALEEHACLLSAKGQTNEAVATLSEAHERYEALGAKRDVARTLEVLECWSSRTSTAASTLPEVLS
ncbi:hypothetical protein BH23GEM5_BH23GEM5_09230 [soil metagenome]